MGCIVSQCPISCAVRSGATPGRGRHEEQLIVGRAAA
jgi:hypothetical protein